MCIAILDPNNRDGIVHLSNETIKICAANNPDGMGIAYFQDGNLKVYRTLNNLNEFIRRYDIGLESELPIVMHFRIKTHGSIDVKNCHPFFVPEKQLVVAHNGIIPPLADNKTKSDTRRFIDTIVSKMPRNALNDPLFRELVSGYIGGSKLIFMNTVGETTIINENFGQWDQGVWFSNEGFLKRKSIVTKFSPPTKTKKKKKKKKKISVPVKYYEDANIDYYGDIIKDGIWYDQILTCIACLSKDFDPSKADPVFESEVDLFDLQCYYCKYTLDSRKEPQIVALLNNGYDAITLLNTYFKDEGEYA